MHVILCCSLSICLFIDPSPTTIPLQRAFINLSRAYRSFLCSLVLLFVYGLDKYPSILISLDALFALIYVRQLLCLTILLIPLVFTKRQYSFTFLLDDCQKGNYASLMTGGKYKKLYFKFSSRQHFYQKIRNRNKYTSRIRAVIPWMLNGLSITKMPFHTTERLTGRSLMSLPS